MDIKGDFIVNASCEFCFGFLSDAHNFSNCIPGLESASFINETSFDSVVIQKIGIFKVKFKGITDVVETIPFSSIKTKTKGADLLTKTRMETDLVLEFVPGEENPEGSTKISFVMSVRVVGKLAVLGEVVMRVKARDLAEETIQAVTNTIMTAFKDSSISDESLPTVDDSKTTEDDSSTAEDSGGTVVKD